MSSRHDLQEKQQVYGLLTKLLSAMKALAYAEIHKLQERRQSQKQMLYCYRRVIGALLNRGAKFPVPLLPPLLIAVGTERGFCGDINRRVYEAVESEALENREKDNRGLIFIGERLFRRHHHEMLAELNGAVVFEDVEPLVANVMEIILRNIDRYSLVRSQIVFLDDISNEIIFFPFVESDTVKTSEKLAAKGYRPMLYEDPTIILETLLPEYFFTTLQYCIKSALMSENLQRFAHMQQATKHLGEKRRQLSIKENQVRKKNIIEEIVGSLRSQ